MCSGLDTEHKCMWMPSLLFLAKLVLGIGGLELVVALFEDEGY